MEADSQRENLNELTTVDFDNNLGHIISSPNLSRRKRHRKCVEEVVNENRWSFIFFLNIITYSFVEVFWGVIDTAFNAIILPYIDSLSLGPTSVHIILNAFNIGGLLSTFTIEYINKRYDSKTIMKFSSLASFAIHILLALNTSFFVLFVSRFLLGMIYIYTLVYCVNISIEFFPSDSRGLTMNIPLIGYTVGPIMIYFALYLIDENLTEACIVPINLICSVPCLINYILYQFFIERGPRDLILSGQIDESKRIMRKISIDKFVSQQSFELITKSINETTQKAEVSNATYLELFRATSLRKMTIICTILRIAASLFTAGLWIAVPLIIKKELEEGEVERLNNNEQSMNILIEMIKISFISLFQPFLCFASDIPYIGRIGFMRLCGGTAMLFVCLIFAIEAKYLGLVFGIVSLFMGALTNVLYNYVSEAYPSKIRPIANSYICLVSSISRFVSMILYVYVSMFSTFLTIFISFLLAIVIFVSTFYLEKETSGRDLE